MRLKNKILAAAVAISSLAATSDSAQAGLMLEPMIGASGGSSSVPLVSSDLILGFGGALRLGIEKDDLFSAVETNVQIANLSGGGSGMDFTIGVTVGGTLTYVPLRFHAGYDFSDSYTDPYLSLGGNAFRIGASYYFRENLSLTLQMFRHIYTGVVTKVSSSQLSGIGSVDYNSFGLWMSIPFSLKAPDTPWRTRYRAQPYSSKAPTEF